MLAAGQRLLERTLSPLGIQRYDAIAHERLRLYTLLAIAVFKLANFFGGTWDVQWHVAIGRDSLFIPPHLLVGVAFVFGSLIGAAQIAYETFLARVGIKLRNVTRLGVWTAPAAFFGVGLGYAGALLSAIFDEWWHRTFGIDATLWSPPHLGIMASTMTVDMSLLFGITASARELGLKFDRRSPFFWGIGLAGAFTLEAVCFQMSEAFIIGYDAGGVGLMGMLFPILVGIMFPMPLMLTIKLSRRFWAAALIFIVTIILQYIGIGIAALGFAILQPVSAIEAYVRENPDSSIARVRELVGLTGAGGLIGFKQAWMLWLSAIPLALVSLLHWLPWAYRHILIAAPLYSSSLIIVSLISFRFEPILRDYPTTFADVILAMGLTIVGGIILGRVGLRLANLA